MKGKVPAKEDDENGNFVFGSLKLPLETIDAMKGFGATIPTYEKEQGLPLVVFLDEKSGAVYCECHIRGKDLTDLGDPDATIDPDLQEEFRANRELEPDNPLFLQMVDDAEKGRKFSDIVLEYSTEYNEAKPLKILGGQHRNEAIKRAVSRGVNVIHGIGIYFNLDKDRRAEIMRISNTNINVSPDLRDRIEEQRLEPPMLRHFCYNTDIMKEKEDFGDKKMHGEEFSPTVRMMRSFVVNYFLGKEFKNDIDEGAHVPYLCKTGRDIDPEYFRLYMNFRKGGGFDDPDLIVAGEMFATLHDAQFKKSDKIEGASKKEYKIKAFSLAVITSWAFAAGVLQRDKTRLQKLYSLPQVSGAQGPLNAIAMGKARHRRDPENYRGLGTRSDAKERGRLLQLFLMYSGSEKPKITEKMCNVAIDVFHANQAKINAEEAKKKAF